MDVTATDRSKFGVVLILNVLLCSVFRVDAGSTSGRFYQKITGVGPNLDESDYETRECGTESRCIQMCDKSADCGATLCKVAADEGCAPEQRKCRHVKMISPNVINDSNFLHGINVDLYLKSGVRGINECKENPTLCNSGQCVDRFGGYSCSCPAGSHGSHCEKNCSFATGTSKYSLVDGSIEFNDKEIFLNYGPITKLVLKTDDYGFLLKISVTYGGEYTVNHGSGSPISTSQISLSGDEKIESVEIEYASHVSSSVVADLVVTSIVLTTNRGNVLKTPTEPDETSDNYSVVRGQDLMYLSGNTDFTNAHFPHLTFTFAKCP